MIIPSAVQQSFYRSSFAELLTVLPAGRTEHILVNCDLSVIDILDGITVDFDILLIESEIWSHEHVDQINDAIINHPKLKNIIKIIVTLGYEHSVLGNNTFKISWNHFYNHGYLGCKNQLWTVKPAGLTPNILCLNGRDAVHRIVLGCRLYQENLLNRLIYAQGELTVPLADDLEYLPNIKQYLSLLPIKVDYVGHWNDHSINGDFYTDTYCNIITETETNLWPIKRNTSVQLVTEKSYKPMFAGQIPIMLAGSGHISYLKHFGFDMFEELLPSGYDFMTTFDKIECIVNFVKQGNEFVEDYYFSNLLRLSNNFDLAISGAPWQQTLAEIKHLFS